MKSLNRLISYTAAYVSLVALFSIAPADSAFSQADFYNGKTITIVRGGGPEGSGEYQTRSLMRVLGKHIPGRPSFTIQYIEGAAGRKAANVIYSSTRPDGLTIGSIGAGLVVGPLLGLPGSGYDLDKLIYLGSTDGGDSTPSPNKPQVFCRYARLLCSNTVIGSTRSASQKQRADGEKLVCAGSW